MISEAIAYIVGIVILFVWLIYSHKNKLNPTRIMIISIFILYMTAVISITFFPLTYDPSLKLASDVLSQRLILTPFQTTISYVCLGNPFVIFVQLGGNIIMTIPFGIMLPMIVKNKKICFYLLLVLALPLFIETSQLVLGIILQTFYRTADIDDVIYNFLGGMIGLAIYKLLPKKFRNRISAN
ncbi:MAG: VanZ family protein [Clostridia bacterium]|nr:VanZ family protein [Clostridia bacterium]